MEVWHYLAHRFIRYQRQYQLNSIGLIYQTCIGFFANLNVWKTWKDKCVIHEQGKRASQSQHATSAGLDSCGGWNRSATICIWFRDVAHYRWNVKRTSIWKELKFSGQKRHVLIAEVDANKDVLFGSIKMCTKGAHTHGHSLKAHQAKAAWALGQLIALAHPLALH